MKKAPTPQDLKREAAQEILNIIQAVCRSKEYLEYRVAYGSNGQRDLIIEMIKEKYGLLNPGTQETTQVNTRKDGVYMELFAVKNGIRYNNNIVNMKDATNVLVKGLMDGVEKLWINH